MLSVMPDNSDIFARAMAAVSEELCGKPSKSTSRERRYGSNGSLKINVETGQWISFEDGEKGGVLDLVQYKLGCSKESALAWLEERGHIDPLERREVAERSNGTERQQWTKGRAPGRLVDTYEYRGPDGDLRYRVCRFVKDDGKKDFRQERFEDGQWIGGAGCMNGVELVPYRIDEVQAETSSVVLVVEGEKDVNNLWVWGFVATCNPGGSSDGRWKPEFSQALAGRDVIVLPDNDKPGREHAARVIKSLQETAARVRFLELPDLPEKGDASDWLANNPQANLAAELEQAVLADDHVIERLANGEAATVRACSFPALDLRLIAVQEPPGESWIIDRLFPGGTAGVFAGPGSAGKSYLELVKMICLSAGRTFLGFRCEPVNTLGYFSEDSMPRIWRRVKVIADELGVNLAELDGRLTVVSTVSKRASLFEADTNSSSVNPTQWFDAVRKRCDLLRARYVSFDHVGRLWRINRNDPNQVFDAWSHLETWAHEIDGNVVMLAHPSKGDLRHGKGGPRVGGAIAMIDAPRVVHVLEKHKDQVDGSVFRTLTSEKANYSDRFAIKLVVPEGRDVVENVGEVDPDDPGSAGKGINQRGRPTKAQKTLDLLVEIYRRTRAPVDIAALAEEAVRLGMLKEVGDNPKAWENRRTTIRSHLATFPTLVDWRSPTVVAPKIEALEK